jgi:hypothetical protein
VDTLNRETLAGVLRDRGISFQDTGRSLIVPGDSPPGESPPAVPNRAFVLVVPLNRPGEDAIQGGPEGPEKLPLRFSAALSFIEKTTESGPPAFEGAERTEPAERTEGTERTEPAERIEAAAPSEPPALIVILWGGEGENPAEEAGKQAEAAEEPAWLAEIPERPEYSVLWYLDLGETETGALEFGFQSGRAPALGSLLPLPGLCETLDIPWSFAAPLLAGRRLPYLAQTGGDREPQDPGQTGQYDVLTVRSKAGAGETPEGALPRDEILGELLHRYARYGTWNEHREHNYLILQAGGKTLFIAELPLILIVLGTCSFFLCGIIFIPRFPFKPAPPVRGTKEPGGLSPLRILGIELLLWACLLGTAAMAFFRISLYPLWALALIPAFAARNLHRPLPRRLCLGGLGLYLGFLLIVTFR